ncbi:MAG: hydantoinase/oxoprolinase family protein [Actinomycetota bacterium]|nr:hydantoinase/oxoprolinase family protein [Actinomycetota bacterium]
MNNASGKYRIAVDTGGTFTDAVIAVGEELVAVGKASTTASELNKGFRSAVENAADNLGVEFEDLLAGTDRLVFGTTHAVNALVQRKTAKTALLVTDGFADVLLFREGGRPDELMFEFDVEYPSPYIPRNRTFELDERMSAEGEVVRPLDEEKLVETLRSLKDRGYEAVAVCLLWSVVNPDHELRIGELIERELPGVPYTLSHKLLRIVREYRRASATAIDASLKPMVQSSLGDLERELRAWGYAGPILVSTSAGGCVSIAQAAERPVYLLKSGPAMAPVAGRSFTRDEDLARDVIVCDTGGTTFDVGLIREDEIVFARDTWFGPVGMGELVATSTVDIRSIGSGGGSIAHVDPGGLLRVGPQSAGADPGPACYGQGGEEPTVTDAALILGYLQPDHFLGGRMELDHEAARRAIGRVADKLGFSTERTAAGIMTLANESMIDAIGELTLNVGLDPRENVLVAGGGAAGLNIVPIAREIGIQQLLIPRAAGALSACGMQFSDIVFEHGSSLITRSGQFDRDGVNAVLDEVEAELDAFMSAADSQNGTTWAKEFRVEARYAGQVWEVPVTLPGDRVGDQSAVDELVEAFHETHRQIFSFADDANDVEFINWVGRLVGEFPRSDDGAAESPSASVPDPSDRRPAWFDGVEVDTPIFLGEDLGRGAVVDGPAIVVDPTSTLVLDPESSAVVTAEDNYLVSVHTGQGRSE